VSRVGAFGARSLVAALCLSLAPNLLALPAHDGFDAGPIASRDRALSGFDRVRALGPFYEHSVHPDGSEFFAVRPFYSHVRDADGDGHSEVLWPLFSSDRIGRNSTWRLFTTYSMDFDAEDDASRERLWILPFYFQGKDERGSYLAVFPLGGKIHDILGMDEVGFGLWPLYAESRVKDVVTRDVVWPFVSWTSGGGHERFRVWPLYGEAHSEVASKRFIMWPLWTDATYHEPEGRAWMLWPLYSNITLEDQVTHMVVPPFFRYSRGEGHRLIHSPWPFVQYESGRDIEKLYIWPLYGTKAIENVRRSWALWPVVQWERLSTPQGDRLRQWAALVYFYERDRSRGRDNRHLRIWPLFEHKTVGDQSRTRALAIWPLLGTREVERNWAPIWTLYERKRLGEAKETEYLWGLMRHGNNGKGSRFFNLFPLVDWQAHSHNAPSFRWSILKGALAYERKGDRRSMRLLYLLRMGDTGDDKEDEDSATP